MIRELFDSAGLLTTAIETPRDRNADIGLLVDWAEYFRVTDPAGELRCLLDAIDTWRERAECYGVASEATRLAPAFEHEQRKAARRLAGR
jgi:hypothetical protein